MIEGSKVLVLALGYVGLLFVVAWLGDRTIRSRKGGRGRPVTYALSLAVYCTSWTFFGSVGLAAATGVMDLLAERNIGFGTPARKVPIVPAAVLYDLGLGKATAFPGEREGRLAAKGATGGAVAQGTVGAGTGATIAKMLGPERRLKGGIGTASASGPKGLLVGALVANNATGHAFDPETGALIAGPRDDAGGFVPLAEAMHRRTAQMDALLQNTTLICVATNAAIDHHHLQRLAYQAHDGLARVIVPAHTFGDGDVAFAVTTGKTPVQPHDVHSLGILAARAVERALVKSVAAATGLHGVPSACEWAAAGSQR